MGASAAKATPRAAIRTRERRSAIWQPWLKPSPRASVSPSRAASGLFSPEDRRPLLDEGARRLAMIFGPPGLDLMLRLEVEQFVERPAFRRVEIFLH